MTSDWCNEVGLNVNPTKTVIVPFTRRYKLQRLRQIRLLGSEITTSKEVKYLGVTFDSKLNFDPHVKNTIREIVGNITEDIKMAIPYGCQAHAHIWSNCLG